MWNINVVIRDIDPFLKTVAAVKMTKNRWRISGYWRNASASTAVAFTLTLPALMGAAGIAIDFSIYNMKQTKLQAAADQSAVAAAKELAVVNTSETSIAEVADSLARAILTHGNVTVDAAVGAKKDTVKVTITEKWTPFFAHFIGAGVTPVVARATAKLAGAANICVLALNSTNAKAIHMDKRAKLEANGCGVYSNSNHSESIRLDQDSTMTAALICSVGGAKSRTSAIKPAVTTDCVVLPDPLSSRKAPAAGTCTANKFKLDSGSAVLDPGTYCGGITITGTATATFRRGDYIISDGNFEISGDAVVKSNNAAFYLKGEKTQLKFIENTTIEMTGGLTGDMAGLLFFEDRSVSIGRIHRLNSANARKLTGTIYLPNGKLRVDPNNAVAQDSAFTAIIANQVEMDEGPTLVLNSDYGATDVPAPEGVRLSSQVVLTK